MMVALNCIPVDDIKGLNDQIWMREDAYTYITHSEHAYTVPNVRYHLIYMLVGNTCW